MNSVKYLGYNFGRLMYNCSAVAFGCTTGEKWLSGVQLGFLAALVYKVVLFGASVYESARRLTGVHKTKPGGWVYNIEAHTRMNEPPGDAPSSWCLSKPAFLTKMGDSEDYYYGPSFKAPTPGAADDENDRDIRRWAAVRSGASACCAVCSG